MFRIIVTEKVCVCALHDSSTCNIDGALTVIHVCVDSSRTVLEHHRLFILSTLVSHLEEKKKRGTG